MSVRIITRKSWRWRVWALMLFAVGSSACQEGRLGRQARSRYPYVVLISIDTLHVEETGPYNPDIEHTPNLDRFAREGVLFQRAYTPVPITLPSHANLMTGMSPLMHNAMANGDVVPDSVITLAEIFRDAGYRTGGFPSLGVLKSAFKLDQGFEDYVDPFVGKQWRWYRDADEIFPSIEEWVNQFYGTPFFMWVHFSDPHEPYLSRDEKPDTRLVLDGQLVGEWKLATRHLVTVPVTLTPGRHSLTWTSIRKPRPDDTPRTGVQIFLYELKTLRKLAKSPLPPTAKEIPLRPSWSLELANSSEQDLEVELNFTGQMVRPPPSEVSENYPKEVEWVDRYLGELRTLLESRGIEERTLWVLVSDHGEGLYRHNRLGHATFVLEDQLRLLLQFRGPGVPEGRVVEQPAVMMDVAPTILDLVGLPIPSEVEGRSLVGCWDGGSCPERDRWWAYGYNHRTRRLASIAEYQWPYKYIWKRGSGKRVFNLDRDPGEENNLIDVRPHPKEVLELSRRFHRQRPKLAWILNHRQRRIQHKDSLELLKSLGYIGDTGSDPGK